MSIFCLLTTNSLHGFFLWMHFSVYYVHNLSLWSVSLHTKKFFIAVSGFAFIYKDIYFSYYFQFSLLVVLFFFLLFFFLWETGENVFCAAFLGRKTNLLDFNIKISTLFIMV